MDKILLDNNGIDFILENEELFIKATKKYNFYVCTNVVEELAKIPDTKKEKRIRLFITLCKFGATFINDSCHVLGVGRLGMSNLGEGTVYYEILNENNSNVRDAIIADTAVTNNCILLTDDTRLNKKMKNLNYRVMKFKEFEKDINNG
jgi:rRNA-processing protein FCF1